MFTWVLSMAQHNKVATGRRRAPVDLTARCLRIDIAPMPDSCTTSNPDDAPMMNRIERTTRLEASLAEMRDHLREHYVRVTATCWRTLWACGGSIAGRSR
jgi:hypothetical protein